MGESSRFLSDTRYGFTQCTGMYFLLPGQISYCPDKFTFVLNQGGHIGPPLQLCVYGFIGYAKGLLAAHTPAVTASRAGCPL